MTWGFLLGLGPSETGWLGASKLDAPSPRGPVTHLPFMAGSGQSVVRTGRLCREEVARGTMEI